MIIKLYSEKPNERVLRNVAEILLGDGLVIYPTDTVYAVGCALSQPRAIARLNGLKAAKEQPMSILCRDLSQVAEYARMDNIVHKLLRRNLPGPFTFILPAASVLSDKVMAGRRTIGVRVTTNPITQAIIETLGCPLVTTSLRGLTTTEAEDAEYYTDPELIDEKFGDSVDAVIDGGPGGQFHSTVVDCTDGEPFIIRQGEFYLEH